jgi:ElaB/YqjD/DUF883 family membrane-anchored ribosome-binding protein
MADETTTATDETGTAGDGRFGKAKAFVNDQYNAASDAARKGYNQMREKVEDVDFGAVADQVRSYVRSNPGKALLLSVGIGFVIGLLLRRDEEE